LAREFSLITFLIFHPKYFFLIFQLPSHQRHPQHRALLPCQQKEGTTGSRITDSTTDGNNVKEVINGQQEQKNTNPTSTSEEHELDDGNDEKCEKNR
jgi:hypothetical protein